MKNKFEKTSNLWCCPYLNVSRNVDWEGEAKEDGLVPGGLAWWLPRLAGPIGRCELARL